MAISVARIYSEDTLAYAVNECFDDIVESGTPMEVLDGYIDVQSHCWIGVSKDDKFLGAVKFKPYNNRILEIHPFILPSFRRFSHDAVSKAIEWFDTSAPVCYTSLITNVPDCKRYAKVFALSKGFQEVGRFANAFEHEGIQHDMVLYQRERRRWVI